MNKGHLAVQTRMQVSKTRMVIQARDLECCHSAVGGGRVDSGEI
jgi:hypothetical protein